METFVDHSDRKVIVNRGPFRKLKVFAAWFLLSGFLGIAADFVTLPLVLSCSPRSSSTCTLERRMIDSIGNVIGMAGSVLLLSWKFDSDAKRRYLELPESEREADS